PAAKEPTDRRVASFVARQHPLNLVLVVAHETPHGSPNLLLFFVHRHSSTDEVPAPCWSRHDGAQRACTVELAAVVIVESLEAGAAELEAGLLEVALEAGVLPAHPLGVDEEAEA